MVIPVVPIIPRTTVINKTIVYSDTILPLKDSGNNLKITSIPHVSEFSLEECLKTILKSNPNVIFNTIQYSQENKRVYFYTNEEISTKEYEKRKIINYKPITSSTKILEELKNLFIAEKNKGTDCISLYDVLNLVKKEKNQYDNTEKYYESRLNYLINNKYEKASVVVYRLDYDTNELEIGFNELGITFEYDKIKFTKKNGDLFITQSETSESKGHDILVILRNTLSKLYDEFEKYRDFEKQYNYSIKSINSNFLSNISQYGISIYLRSQSNLFGGDFVLTAYSYKNEYTYECNSNMVLSEFSGKESEIFKRIFVKIEDCPKWSKPILYEIRQNQLAEERRKEKRLALARKIFPFLKK